MREHLPELLVHSGVPTLFQPFTRGFAAIFVLHRFHDPEAGIRGHTREEVDRGIGYLRERGYELLPLSDLFLRLRVGRPPLRKAVVFTMDDGYADQATVGIPLFEAHDCPLTVFLTTGFLDGDTWLWWDRVEYIFLQTRSVRLEVDVGGERVVYHSLRGAWGEPDWSDFIERCKRVPEAEKHRAIARLAEVAGVELPTTPPPPFQPMTWDQVRAAEARGGATFGPHTVTHPILSRTDDAQARHELEESWRRLRQETVDAQPIFCYPNGWEPDYGTREIAILRELGFLGAMAVQEDYVDSRFFRSRHEEAYRVPRFSYPTRFRSLVQCITGIDRFVELMRSEA